MELPERNEPDDTAARLDEKLMAEKSTGERRQTSPHTRLQRALQRLQRRRRASLATSYRGPSLLATHQMGRLSPLALAVAAPQPDRGRPRMSLAASNHASSSRLAPAGH